MTDATMIDVIVQRPLHLAGKPHPTGARLRLAPLQAGNLLLSGRAALADERDRPEVIAALRAEDARLIATDRRGPAGYIAGG